MLRFLGATGTVEAAVSVGRSHPSWRDFCAWCVERGIALRVEQHGSHELVAIEGSGVIREDDVVVVTSGPCSQVRIVTAQRFTADYLAIVEHITAVEIARDQCRGENQAGRPRRSRSGGEFV